MMKNQFAGKMYWKIGIGISSTRSELLVNKPSFIFPTLVCVGVEVSYQNIY